MRLKMNAVVGELPFSPAAPCERFQCCGYVCNACAEFDPVCEGCGGNCCPECWEGEKCKCSDCGTSYGSPECCTDVGFCEMCESDWCGDCRGVIPCVACDVYSCEDCDGAMMGDNCCSKCSDTFCRDCADDALELCDHCEAEKMRADCQTTCDFCQAQHCPFCIFTCDACGKDGCGSCVKQWRGSTFPYCADCTRTLIDEPPLPDGLTEEYAFYRETQDDSDEDSDEEDGFSGNGFRCWVHRDAPGDRVRSHPSHSTKAADLQVTADVRAQLMAKYFPSMQPVPEPEPEPEPGPELWWRVSATLNSKHCTRNNNQQSSWRFRRQLRPLRRDRPRHL